MLSLHHKSPLYFPKLVSTGLTDPTNFSKVKFRIYSLDWNLKEEMAFKKHSQWNSKHWPNNHSFLYQNFHLPFIPSLPPKIDSWVINLRFSLNDSYVDEIRRNAQRCLEEWNIKRPFDTNVREYCLQTAISHAFVAFYLLEDCAYDVEKEGFYRKHHEDKMLIKHALAYKLWAHQTGRGCVRRNARLEDLEGILELFNRIEPRTAYDLTKDFLDSIEEHEQKAMEVQPSISEKDEGLGIYVRRSF